MYKADHGHKQLNPRDGVGRGRWVDFRGLLSNLSSHIGELWAQRYSQKLTWLKKTPDIDFWAPHAQTFMSEHNCIYMCIPPCPHNTHFIHIQTHTHNTHAYTCNTPNIHKAHTKTYIQRLTERCTYNRCTDTYTHTIAKL